MKNLFLILLLLSVFISTQAQYYLKKDYIEIQQKDEKINSVTYKNLKIIPLFAGTSFIAANNDVGKYKTLNEVLGNGKVEIKETGAAGNRQNSNINSNEPVQQAENNLSSNSGNVNQLMIRNLTNDTIFIMGGELVQGGKQDRVVGENFLLPPGKEFVPLPVFCVEHGRWTYKEDNRSGFNKYNSFTANSVRSKAVKNSDQSAVWAQVSEVTTANKADTSTGSFNSLYNNEKFMGEMKEYKDYFISALGDMNGCIGFVGISGDRVVGCDIFATTELFKKEFVNLLSAYITEAITENKTPTLSDSKVNEYLQSFLIESTEQDKLINEKGKSFEYEGKRLHIATF